MSTSASTTPEWEFKESPTEYGRRVDVFRKQLLTEALQAHGGNRTYAAKALGLQRTYLVRLIKLYRIDVPPQRRHNGSN